MEDGKFCLEKLADGSGCNKLKRNHAYYYQVCNIVSTQLLIDHNPIPFMQVQAQLICTESKYKYYCVH